MLAVRRIRIGLGGLTLASTLGGLGERLDRRISWAKRLCDEFTLELDVKVGDFALWRGESGGLIGAGRSISGMAGSDRPRRVNGEMSDSEVGEAFRSDVFFRDEEGDLDPGSSLGNFSSADPAL